MSPFFAQISLGFGFSGIFWFDGSGESKKVNRINPKNPNSSRKTSMQNFLRPNFAYLQTFF